MTFFKKVSEDSKTFRKTIIALFVIFVIVGMACFRFYNQVRQTVLDESEHYLREITNRIGSNIERSINDNFSILKTMKVVLEDNAHSTFAEVGEFLHQQETDWSFYRAILIDDAGIAYDGDGKEISISGDSFLRALSQEEGMIAPSQIINNEETLVFTIPISIQVENKNIVSIATCYKPEEFDKLLSMTSFDEMAYSYIVDKEGKAITRSSSNSASHFGYNIIRTIEDENSDEEASIQKLLEEMKENQSSQYDFEINGTHEYVISTPIEMEDWYLLTFVPVSVVNSKSSLLLQSTILMTGLVFLVFTIFLIIIISSFTRHRRKLEQIAYIDDLTGGNTIQRFHELVQETMHDADTPRALIFTNIQKFKVLNDQFGRFICDEIIINIHKGILSDLEEDEFIGHQGADNFCVLVNYKGRKVLEKRLYEWGIEMGDYALSTMNTLPLFVMEYGIYVIEDSEVELADMLDRAKLSLRDNAITHKLNGYIHYAFYDDATREQLLMEKHLEDMMEQALIENEFQVYLQPKYSIIDNTIAGAEALVRWQSKEKGMIYPNDFIPLFEKNGFIIKLDLWMFEQTCMLLQKWIDEGKQPVRVSVNCSRAHLKNVNFLKAYENIFKKYHVPSKYLELEFTENMVFEETQRLAKIIDDIHKLGFECSMDDFGSGYSSLNLLQEIHVDTLKLDRIFFKNSFREDPRTRAIITCVLDMAQSLNITTVAEGIEDWEQVESLRNMGCDLVQGYVYAKPMPTKDFEKLLFQTEKEKGDVENGDGQGKIEK